MGDQDSVLQAKIFYYARERYYRSMKASVNEALQKYSNDPLLKFLSAYCSILQGALSEGINELEYLKDKRDMNLCCYWGLMTAYKLCSTFDKEAYSSLDAKLKEERKQAGDRALYHAGLFLFLIGKPERAREYIERSIKINSNAKDALCLRGWVELHTSESGSTDQAKRALEYFDRAMGDGQRHADALLGKSAAFTSLLNFSASLECTSQMIVTFPKFLPAMVEKMKIQLYMQDWDAMAETALRCLADEPHCLEALKYMSLKLLAFHGNYEEGSEKISELCDLASVVEPNNSSLFAELAQLFSKICGRDTNIITQTTKLAEVAAKIAGNRADPYVELGIQYLFRNRFREASNCFDTAMKYDSQCADATLGLIRCQVLQNRFSEADHQLQFMKELQHDSLAPSQLAQVFFLTALLVRKKGDSGSSEKTAVEMLHKASETQIRAMRDYPLGPSCFIALDPDFMLEIVQEYLHYAPDQAAQPGQPINALLKRCEEILRAVTKAAPGLLEASFLLGKIKFLLGDVGGAQAMLEHCLELNPSLSEAHILMAKILFERGSFQQAEESLQQGLSFNFEIKDNPTYQMLRSRLLRRRGENEDALNQLQAVIRTKSFQLSQPSDKAAVFLELISCHLALGQQGEAARVSEEGQATLKGSPAALMRLQLADADLALARGDVETTLAKLRAIEPDNPLFVDSRQKLASIYLKHRRDQRLYISCYKEICDQQQQSIGALLMLGDAYMDILEAEKAIEVYETAAKRNPRDFQLAQKIGQAHVKTHNYSKAVNYYEASLKAGGQRALYVDLLKLFIRLRHFEKGEKVVKQLLTQQKDGGNDLQSLMEDTNFHWLYAQILLKTNRNEDAVTYLEKAKDLQARVLKRTQLEQPDALPAQREQAVELCRTLADCYIARSELDTAFKSLKDALQMSEGEGKSMLAMARLCLLRQDLDRCQQLCSSLLKDERETEEATLLLGEVLCQKDDDEAATELFQQFVKNNPTSFTALSRLIDLLHRAGRLSSVPAYFEMLAGGRPGSGSTCARSGGSSGRLALEPGYLYCQGLYEWYSCNTSAALKLLNKARRDASWGLKASYLMVEISLNPDRVVMGSELFGPKNAGDDGAHDADTAESDQMALRTAEKLLEDVKPRLGDRRRDILRTWLLICRKTDAGLDRAIQDLLQIQTTHGKSVSVLYALSVAFCLKKGQLANGKKWLKELAQWQWTFENADELERAWLLLADIYIAAGNVDTARRLLDQCINHNKSSWRAYEYLAFIAERDDKDYEEATRLYYQAWYYCNKNNPNIGFKYAFNCLRERQTVEAIETSLHILKNNPAYPRIRKEILEKARSNVRM